MSTTFSSDSLSSIYWVISYSNLKISEGFYRKLFRLELLPILSKVFENTLGIRFLGYNLTFMIFSNTDFSWILFPSQKIGTTPSRHSRKGIHCIN
jgi:hypothetical protein